MTFSNGLDANGQSAALTSDVDIFCEILRDAPRSATYMISAQVRRTGLNAQFLITQTFNLQKE